MNIEDVHRENFRLIEANGIDVGMYFTPNHGTSGIGGTVKYIHGLYGWIIFDNANMPQRAATLLEGYRNVDPEMVIQHK